MCRWSLGASECPDCAGDVYWFHHAGRDYLGRFSGTLMARWLRTESSQKVFTAVMALALVASMMPVLFL
jgi:hypothetical protein